MVWRDPLAVFRKGALVPLFLLGSWLAPKDLSAQRTNPPYLAEFPLPARVRAELKGSDPIDSSARVMAAWRQLQGIIRALSGSRWASMQQTPDEDRLHREYGSIWQRGLYKENLPPEKDEPRWRELRDRYEKDTGFRDQLLQRFFSAEFRSGYYQATSKPASPVVAAKPAPSPSPPPAPAPAPAPAVKPGAPPSAPPRVGTAAWHLAEGDRLKTAKEYANAIESYKSAIRLDPAMARAHFSLGFCYFMLKQYSNAVAPFQQALKLEPTNPEYHVQLGASYYYVDKDDSALSELLEAKRLKADDWKADDWPTHFWLGMVYNSLEQFPQAIAAYQEAIRVNPNVPNIRYMLGITYVDMGRKQDALAVAEALKKLDRRRADELAKEIGGSFSEEDNAEDNLLLGMGYFRTPSTRHLAMRPFRRVLLLKASPDTLAEAHQWIGLVYEEEKEYKKAAAEYQEAIRLNPHVPANHFRLGLMYLALGQRGQAHAVHRTLQALDKATAEKLMGEINKARPVLETPTIRFDGLYRTADGEYLRFYQDGTVIGARFRGTPESVAGILKKPYGTTGQYAIKGSTISFSLVSKDRVIGSGIQVKGGTVSYTGTIGTNSVTLNWRSTGVGGVYKYEFIPVRAELLPP